MGSVGDLRTKGPALLRSFLGWSSMAGGGISVGSYPVKCALGWSYYGLFGGAILFPLVLMAALLLQSSVMRRFVKAKVSLLSFWLGCVIILMFLIYGSSMKTLLELFGCEGPFHGGQSWLSVDLSVPCYDSTHTSARILAGVLLLIWVLAGPALVLYMAPSHRAHLQTDPRYAFLFVGYASHCMWWESSIIVRKLLLQVLVVFVRHPQLQSVLCSLVIMASVVLHLSWKPYKTAFLNQVETMSLLIPYASLSTTQLYSLLNSQQGASRLAPSVLRLLDVAVTLMLVLINLLFLAYVVVHSVKRKLRDGRVQPVGPRGDPEPLAAGGAATLDAAGELCLTVEPSEGDGDAVASSSAPAARLVESICHQLVECQSEPNAERRIAAVLRAQLCRLDEGKRGGDGATGTASGDPVAARQIATREARKAGELESRSGEVMAEKVPDGDQERRTQKRHNVRRNALRWDGAASGDLEVLKSVAASTSIETVHGKHSAKPRDKAKGEKKGNTGRKKRNHKHRHHHHHHHHNRTRKKNLLKSEAAGTTVVSKRGNKSSKDKHRRQLHH